MDYEVFARKYRPRVFEDLIGQEAIAQTLRHAVASERTASVYVFAGSHGVGKTSVARILAKALNCPNAKDGSPCGTCETCEAIGRGDHLDVIEIDAASNSKIEDVRQLRESVGYKPASGKYKVYILDEVHRLSGSAFDGLLKTFEDSAPHVRFVLATTELHKVPTTIRSRAQVFLFQRASQADIVRGLRRICDNEKLTLDDDALRAIARRARGSMRDSHKLLDQVVALASAGPGGIGKIGANEVAFVLGDASHEVVARCLRAIAGGQPGALLGEVHEHVRAGGRPDALAQDLVDALRGALYLKTAGPTSPLLEDVALAKEDLEPIASALSEEGLLYALQLLQQLLVTMKEVRDTRLAIELVLVRLARARELVPASELLARLERLEKAGPAPSTSAAPARPAPLPAPVPGPAPAPVQRGYSRGEGPARPEGPARGEGRGDAPPPGATPSARPAYDYPAEFTRKSAPPAPVPPVSPVAHAAHAAQAAVAVVEAPPVAAATPAGAPSTLSLGAIQAQWERVREAARKHSVQFDKILGHSTAKAIGPGPNGPRLTLEVRVANFLFAQLDQPSQRDPLAALVRDVLGVTVDLAFERGKPDEAPRVPGHSAPAPAHGSKSVYDEPIVKHAQRALGSQPVAGGW